MEGQDRFFTTQDVAEKLSVDPEMVRQWIRSGQLDAIDVSRKPGLGKARYRIAPEALERFTAARRVAKPQPIGRRRSQVKRVFT